MIDLKAAIQKALSCYVAEASLGDVPIEVERIKRLVCGYSQVDAIDVIKFKFDTKYLIAQVQFMRHAAGALYNGTDLRAQIYFSSSLNDCWRRFVVCKEIMHCILDDSDARRVGTIEDLIKLSESLVNRTLAAMEKSETMLTEVFAEVMAIELMFPLELREAWAEDYRSGALTDMQIALRLKIPEQIVRSAMAPSYLVLSSSMLRDVRFPL